MGSIRRREQMDNFDCTQFITFDYLREDADMLAMLIQKLEKLGFEILQGEQIRGVKKLFFHKQIRGVFMELKNEEFLGGFYQWKTETSPPSTIAKFKDIIEELVERYDVENMKLMFSYFAEEKKTSTEVFTVCKDRIMQGLFFVTPNTFEKWADNYVVEIV